jgi:CBS domain-containing protein
MRDSGCGCAPVVEDTESLKLVGVVTERDVCCSVAADDRHPSEVLVEEIMRPISACCEADQPIDDTRSQLHQHRSTSLPVMDEAGGCCGTVSIESVGHSRA